MNCRFGATISFIVMLSIMFYLFYTGALISNSFILVSIQVISILIIIWSRKELGVRSLDPTALSPEENSAIVMTGPYQFVRHPIYSAVSMFIWAGVISHFSIVTFCLGIVATLSATIRAVCEEKLIILNCPVYSDYTKRTKRVIPFIF